MVDVLPWPRAIRGAHPIYGERMMASMAHLAAHVESLPAEGRIPLIFQRLLPVSLTAMAALVEADSLYEEGRAVEAEALLLEATRKARALFAEVTP